MRRILRGASRRRVRNGQPARRGHLRLALRTASVSIVAALAVALVANVVPRDHNVVTVAAAATSTTTTVPASASAKPTKAFCDLVRAYTDEIRQISISFTDPAVLQPLLDAAAPAILQSQSLATATAGPDVSTVKAAIDDLKSGFEAAGYDFAKLRPETAVRLTTSQFISAFARLDALAREAC